MIEGRPSLTAQGVAMRRAVHQLVDSPPVFDDPIALRIIGPEGRSRLPEAAADANGPTKYLRAFLAVRSRYAEDKLAAAVEDGIRKYVVLGAGFDTFAYRNPFGDRLHVFEVDHPTTQEWKRQCLAHSGISIPSGLTFIPVDFESQSLESALQTAGLVSEEPAFFSWLGVTPYLEQSTVIATLQLIHSLCPANSVVFDYGVPSSSLGEVERAALDELASRVARGGEHLRTFFEPETLAKTLNEIGFRRLEDLGPDDINLRYFKGRSDGLCVRGGARLMYARG